MQAEEAGRGGVEARVEVVDVCAPPCAFARLFADEPSFSSNLEESEAVSP